MSLYITLERVIFLNKFIKKVIVGFTVATITFSGLGTSFAMPLLLHQDKESKNLSSGVVHEHIKQPGLLRCRLFEGDFVHEDFA